MADSFSPKLRLRLQQTGANTNTWGSLLNAAALQLVEDSVAGVANITVAGADVTLTTANGATDQARMAIINLTGAPGAPRNVIVPSATKLYLIVNGTGQVMTVKTAAGSGVAVPDGAAQYVFCDGTNVRAVQASALGTVANSDLLDGLDSTAFWKIASFNQATKGHATTFVTLTDGGTTTLTATDSNKFIWTIGGNRTLQINNPSDGQTIELVIKQDGTGGRLVTWPANVSFTGSSTLSTAANAIDIVELTYNLTLDKWFARLSTNAASTSTFNVSTDGTQLNVNVFELCGSPSGAVTVNLITTGRIYSLSPSQPAIDFSGFTAASTINWENRAKVMGCGGRGGDGGWAQRIGDDDTHFRGCDGEDGGTAVKGPGAGITFNITNANGFIWGGGGGGGGGGVSSDDGSNIASADGGGGGAGGGQGARYRTVARVEGTSVGTPGLGTNGTYATSSANGTGGAGTETGSAEGGDGGNGGDWGTAGSAGQSPTAFGIDIAGGAAGGAGKAVDQAGGTATFVSGSGAPNVKGAVV